jgi:hypothetical protein
MTRERRAELEHEASLMRVSMIPQSVLHVSRLIYEALAHADYHERRVDALRGRLQAMSKRWHEQADECWWGKEKSCGDHDDGRGDGLDDCADEIDALLAEVSGA